ncbi:MAG: fibronectin type III domain-containing protein [Chloroflexota bacterium]|nr:fibronectin type III domain-containing protein [Chloroflexota bacterium]
MSRVHRPRPFISGWLLLAAAALLVLTVVLTGPGAIRAQEGEPTVTAVAISSDPGGDHTYTVNDVIRITVTFSEAVDVTGTPQLKIDMDPAHWGQKQAAYNGGSGSTALTFTHTVVQPNYSTRGIAVVANSLALNGGAIQSAASQTVANLTHSGLAHDPNHKVNWQQFAPTVAGVAITSDPGDDDTYAKDDIIRVTLTFSEAVAVTGAPRLKIDMDPAHWGQKQAAYNGGSGSTALTFAHTVVEPNFSTRGIAVLANSLALNGGSITSAASQTAANLAHAGLAHDSGHKVDWQLAPACEQTAPSSVSALTIGKGAVVSWTLPADLSDACKVTGFVVSAVNQAEGLAMDAISFDPAARSQTFRGLTPGGYVFSVRVTYAEGDSDGLVTMEANSVPDACITLAVKPYGRNAIAGTIASVNGTGCEAREMFDFEFKRSTEDYWTTYGQMPWSLMRQSDPNLPDFIAYSLEPFVAYDFRISAYDASNSKYVTSPVSATIVAQDPSATADAGSPTVVTVIANNHGNIAVDWAGYSAPAGRTLTGFVLEWKACSVPNDPAGCTGTVSSETHPATSNERRIRGLTDGTSYTVRLAARTHLTSDASKTTSDAWSVWMPALRVWSEPTQLWFRDGPQHVSGRLFMTSSNNKRFPEAQTVCLIADDGGGDPEANCPEGTLVHNERSGSITLSAKMEIDGVTYRSTQSSGRAGGPAAPKVFASGGDGKLVVEWGEASVNGSVGTLDRYIVRHRSGTSGSWTSTDKGVSDRSHTFTALANGTWQVHVRARTDGDDNDPNTQDTPKLGFQSEILTVTLAAGNSARVISPRVKVFAGESQSLIVEWEQPASGAVAYVYQVRHRESGTTAWTVSDELFPLQTRRICTLLRCWNPRSYEISDLTGGTLYEVQVRAKNANGWGDWVGKSRRPND